MMLGQQRAAAASSRSAAARQRRTFLHLLLFRRKPQSPGMENPWTPPPKWQQYLREKAMEDPQYHQALFDQVNTEKNRRGHKVHFFLAVMLITMLALYYGVLNIRTRSLQLDCEDILAEYRSEQTRLVEGDNAMLKAITDHIDAICDEKSASKRGAEFKRRFAGLIKSVE
ncbi:hypothetical protein DIPPA_10646 [Diplonema papillatum]|nr:hypothetical protein DIPPA_10646 [Diplonema papillatum]